MPVSKEPASDEGDALGDGKKAPCGINKTHLLYRSKHGLRHMYFFAFGDPQAMTPEELRERRRVIGQWTRYTKAGKCDPAIPQEWEARSKATDKRQAAKAVVLDLCLPLCMFRFMFGNRVVSLFEKFSPVRNDRRVRERGLNNE